MWVAVVIVAAALVVVAVVLFVGVALLAEISRSSDEADDGSGSDTDSIAAPNSRRASALHASASSTAPRTAPSR
jgi:hypothetical protein